MTDQSLTLPLAGPPLRNSLLWIILAAWFAAIMSLTQAGLFLTFGQAVPFPLAFAAITPPLIYLVAYRALPSLRAWVAALDLSWVIGAQTWRVIGVVFLMMWGLGELPTIFALTAGLGDLAVGIFALTAVLAIERRSAGWQMRARTLIYLGMADFVAAFGTAIFSGNGFPLRLAGEAPPLLMQSLPMAMIPAFGVPLFIILHIIAWQKLKAGA
jgi:hypothetical protein